MRTLFIFIFMVWGTGWAGAQNVQLIYLKTDLAQSSYFFPKGDSAYLRTFPNTTTSASLFPEDSYELTQNLTNGLFHVVYDGGLTPVGHIEMGIQDYDDLRALGKIDSRYLMYYPGYNYLGETPFHSSPTLMDGVPDSVGINFLLEYDAEQHTLRMPFQCICPGQQSPFADIHVPYLNFRSQIGALGAVFESNNTMALMNDGTVITVLNLYHQITINADDPYTLNGDDRWGDIWLKIDPTTGQYEATPLLSQNGTVLTNSVCVSADGAHIYRTGVLHGQAIQLSPDGTLWNFGTDNDSLFQVFMVKEDSEGHQIWSHPLFAYENTYGADTSNFSLSELRVAPIIELNSDLYLGLYYRINLSNETDSLYFDDYMGGEGLFGKPSWFEPNPIMPGFVAKSAREIIRFNANGEPIEKLVFPIRDPDQWGFYNARWFFQKPKLFEVNGKLGWPLTYRATTDTTFYFLNQTMNQPTDSIGIELPAGSGTFILWLDESLEVIDHTLFTFSTQSAMARGVSISNIKPLNGDTLVVFGSLGSNTTTNLDPAGIAAPESYASSTSFMALYSIPDFLLNTTEYSPLQVWNIFPNPATGILSIEGNYEGPLVYYIYDMAGRQVQSGYLAEGQLFYTIRIDKLDSGMYVANFRDGRQTVAMGKFVVY